MHDVRRQEEIYGDGKSKKTTSIPAWGLDGVRRRGPCAAGTSVRRPPPVLLPFLLLRLRPLAKRACWKDPAYYRVRKKHKREDAQNENKYLSHGSFQSKMEVALAQRVCLLNLNLGAGPIGNNGVFVNRPLCRSDRAVDAQERTSPGAREQAGRAQAHASWPSFKLKRRSGNMDTPMRYA